MAEPMQVPIQYNEAVVRKFVIASVFWAVVAFLVGVYIAAELAWPEANLGFSFINFGRLRPVHTDFRLWWFDPDRLLALYRAANLPRPPVRRGGIGRFPVLGLPVLHRHGRA